MRPSQTHHHRDFDAADLAARKAAGRTTVAVVIPALNEQDRVGRVVRVLRESVVERHRLVDDLVVVDGESNDRTVSIARQEGARVVNQRDVLPEAGSAPGKGEALWKGLAATSADIVCFVDADIVDIDERFVVGLLGPLLHDPDVLFTKACYDRPLQMGDRLLPDGGGRVTELLARPLLNAFWPELAWLAQPLSGEYAGRRSLLESLPFAQGYGVELAMLVDIVAAHGPGVIAQVDLGTRQHEHQDLAALSRMSAEVLAVAMDRLTRQDKVVLSDPLASSLWQPKRSQGALTFTKHEVRGTQRPPLSQWRAENWAVDHDGPAS